MMNCRVELLWWTPVVNCRDNQPLTVFIISAINCWSVRCNDICMLTDRYPVVTIPHCSGCRGYLAYRTFGSNLVVSVAWQWIFPALGNSAFQTICHIAPFLGLFVPNSLTASRRSFRGLRWHLFLLAWFRFLPRWSLSNRHIRSLLIPARPEWFPNQLPASPSYQSHQNLCTFFSITLPTQSSNLFSFFSSIFF
jgi:hypothetical protein